MLREFNRKSWKDKVLKADDLWAQLATALEAEAIALPQTPRRPDVRLVVQNTSGQDITFKNPGDHSGDHHEHIPADGDKSAVMIMLAGDTLKEQRQNAADLYTKYNLGRNGLSDEFMTDLKSGKLSPYIREAYGPAPFIDQAQQLKPIDWNDQNHHQTHIKPEHGDFAAYGARPATLETVFLSKYEIYIQGSDTTPELVESDGMCIAVSTDWQTGRETTRPIAPSVAKEYYGEHYDRIPVATFDPTGDLKSLSWNASAPKPQAKAHPTHISKR